MFRLIPIECPYSPYQLMLGRDAWVNGFSAARKQYENLVGDMATLLTDDQREEFLRKFAEANNIEVEPEAEVVKLWH